jgi:hypothetical protein
MMARRFALSGAPLREPARATPWPAQRRSVWMGRLRQWLVQVDLPVDVVVVLEQKERAGETQGAERALRE